MKNGFTLVELLAVIVILAVLALIATPVVLSIIDDAKESAMLRSAEMYLSGVENAVMRENMNSGGNFRPTSCEISNGNMTCGSTNVEVEVDGEVPYAGSIEFENGKIKQVTLNYTSGTIIKDDSGNLVYEGSQTKSICTLASDSPVEAGEYGAKYNCKVDPNKLEYTFYLIDNNDDGTSDLIMNANINALGEAVIPGVSEDEGHIFWSSETYQSSGVFDTDNGPIIAMTYLYNATKSWTNVDPVNYIYNNTGVGYTRFVSENGIARIEKDSVELYVIGTYAEPLRTRMPIYSTDATISEIGGKLNEFLYYNLGNNDDSTCMDENGNYWGYWSLTTTTPDVVASAWFAGNPSCSPWINYFSGVDSDYSGTSPFSGGVRPVINVKL